MFAENEIQGLDLIIYADTAGFLGYLFACRPGPCLLNQLSMLPVPGYTGDQLSMAFNRDFKAASEDIRAFASGREDDILKASTEDWDRLCAGEPPAMPPFAAACLGLDDKETLKLQAELCSLYEAGRLPANVIQGRADFAGNLFMYLACLMGSAANRQGHTLVEVSSFTRRHMANWLPDFCDRAAGAARTPLYGWLMRLVPGFLDLAGNLAPREDA